MNKLRLAQLAAEGLISINEMSKLSGVCISSIRGYEALGLLPTYGIKVFRDEGKRFYRKDDVFKMAQIKAERVMNRNRILASQSSHGRN